MKQRALTIRLFIALFAVTILLAWSQSELSLSRPTRMGILSDSANYQLVWQENFDGTSLDTSKWNIQERHPWQWCAYASSHPSLFEMRNGFLRLYCRQNRNLEPNDTARFLCGGINTLGKMSISYGKVEVRARVVGTQGTWPAIWLLGVKGSYGKPDYAEIDLMESINKEKTAHQTIHNYYVDFLKKQKHEDYHTEQPINWRDWNTYTAEILPDQIIMSVNGRQTLVYPKLKGAEGQYTYQAEKYLILDMQYGGTWVKTIAPRQLPAYMDIDWVRVYRYVAQ
jgi:beta-glucanase (GH16 family)